MSESVASSAEKDARLANLCCGHAACQREVRELLAAAWNNGCGTGFVQANRAAFLIDVELRNPYRRVTPPG